MQAVRVLLIILESLVCLLLIGVILLQRARNEGLGLAFGSGMGESIFGSRAGNVLTKITVWLGSIFVVNTVALAMLYSGVTSGESALMKESAPVPVPVEAPVVPSAPAQTPASAVAPVTPPETASPEAQAPVVPATPAPSAAAPAEASVAPAPAPAPAAPVQPAP